MSFRPVPIVATALIQALFLALLISICWAWLERSKQPSGLDRVGHLADLLAAGIADGAGGADLDALLAAGARRARLDSALVLDADGARLAAWDAAGEVGARPGTGAGEPAEGGLAVDVSAPIVRDGAPLGRLQASLPAAAAGSGWPGSIAVAVLLAVTQVLLVAGAMLGLERGRARQLSELQRGAERIASEGPGVQLQAPGDQGLARVATAFNHMSRQLADSYAALRESLAESRALTARVAESEQHKRHLVDTALDGIIAVDSAGKVLDFNPSAERLFGIARGRVIGRPLDACIEGADLRAELPIGELLFGADDQGVGRRREIALSRGDGSDMALEISATRWRTEHGEFRTAFMRDVSERKRYEDALEEAARRANDASMAKSRFLASMSHEIRTPLNAILNMNELLLETELDEEQRSYAATASESARALLSIVNSVLDFSKVEAGRVEPSPQPCDPEEVVGSVVDLLAARAYAKEVQLTVRCDPAVPTHLETDPGLVRQILLNLIGNAIKFTDQGGVRVHLGLGDGGGQLRIEIIDTGIGIAADKQSELFDEFVQADNADNRKFGGSGLGLAISRRLARLLGGDIELRSTLGEGSCFTLHLPVPGAGAAGTAKRYAAIAPLHDWRLGLWADDPMVADDLAGQLAALGVQAEVEPPPAGLGALGCCGEVTLHPAADSPARPGERHPRRIALYQIGSHCPTNLGEPGRAIAALRIPAVPSALIARLVQAATAMPAAGGEPGDELDVRVSRCARTAAPILLAEDSRANQLVATTILQKAGFRVDLAENGLQAVAAANRHAYGLVLMDVAMPEMDGLEATGCIRALPGERGRVPIVAMTANAFDEDRERCLDAGMNDYLSKPIERRSLLETVTRWLEASAGVAATESEFAPRPGRTQPPGPPARPPTTGHEGATERQATTRGQTGMPAPPLDTADGGDDSADQAALDEAVISVLANDLSEELMPAVVATFVEETEQRLDAIERAVEAGDAQQAGGEAHALKGSAATFGARALRDSAFAVEQAGRAGDGDAIRAELDRLRSRSAAAIAALRERYGHGDSVGG